MLCYSAQKNLELLKNSENTNQTLLLYLPVKYGTIYLLK